MSDRIISELPAIRAAALEYMHGDRDDEEWPLIESNFHCIATEPARILEMVEALEQCQQQVKKLPTIEEVVALCDLVGKLSKYTKLAAHGKPDQVRDDLLQ